MTAWPWIAAGVGAAAVTGAYLLRRSKGDAPEAPPADACEKLRALGGQQAVDACKAVKAGLAIVGAVVPDTSDDVNVRLNGPAVARVHPAIVAIVTSKELVAGSTGTYVTYRPLKAPYTTKYQNGYVPIPGHPDYAKGAPGSQSMVSDEWFRRFGGGKSPSSLLSGDRMRDPYTFAWPAGVAWPGPSGAGSRWAFKGQPLLCPAGTTLASGTDHRTVAGPPCVASSSTTVPPPPTVPDGGYRTGGTSTTTSDGGSRRDHRSDPDR